MKITNMLLSDLNSTEYQRPINWKQVRYIVSNFDERLLDPIMVCQRGDGLYYVVDGQHRLTAHLNMGKKEIPCHVVPATGKENEAAMFRDMNSKRSKLTINSSDDYQAALMANDLETISINAIVSHWGFVVNHKQEDNTINAIASLRWVYKKFGGQLLDAEMEVLRKGYEGNCLSLQGTFLKGLAYFLNANKDDQNFKRDIFILKLKKTDPQILLREISNRTKVSLDFLAINMFTNVYNYHRAKTQRIGEGR